MKINIQLDFVRVVSAHLHSGYWIAGIVVIDPNFVATAVDCAMSFDDWMMFSVGYV